MMGRNLRRRVSAKENIENVSVKTTDTRRKLKALTSKPGLPENTMPATRKKRSPGPSKTRPRLALADKTNSISPKPDPAPTATVKRAEKERLPPFATVKKFEKRKADIQHQKQKQIRTKEASHPIRANLTLLKENEQPEIGSLIEGVRQSKRLSTDKAEPIAEKIKASSDCIPHLAEKSTDSADDSYQIEDEWDGKKFLGFEDDDPDIEQNMFINWIDRYKKVQVERNRIPSIKSGPSFPTKKTGRLENCKDPTSTANTGESKNEDILQGQSSRMEKSESGKNLSSPKMSENAVSAFKKVEESQVTAGGHMTRSETQRATSVQKEQFVKPKEPIGESQSLAKMEKANKAKDAEKILQPETTKISPNSEIKKSKRALAPLFSVFNKSLSPRNYSPQNKIFVSRRRESSESASKPQPVYADPTLTPIGKKKQLPVEEKEGMYEFEVDENEPKPKKKHRPILKIQRMRHVNKKRKPNNYVVDPEVEKRVLRNLDMSPSVLETATVPIQNKPQQLGLATVTPGQPSSSRNESVLESDAHTSNLPAHVATAAFGLPSSSTKIPVAQITVNKSLSLTDGVNQSREEALDNGHEVEDDHFDPSPPSPAAPPPSSTPAHRSVSRLMDDTVEKYRRLSCKMYSPVAGKDSPLPVLFANRSRSAMMTPNASTMSRGSHECLSELPGEVGASTPIKQREDDSTITLEQRPLKADISNCFGFDEPESFEEPLVSPIKRPIRLNYDRPVAPSPTRTFLEFRRKFPINSPYPSSCVPPVDVKEVINKLKAEVGPDPNSSEMQVALFLDDCEKQMPIKRFFQAEPEAKPDPVVNESSVVQDDSIFHSLPLPRVSYSRPGRTRKRKIMPEMEYNERSMCHSSENESGGSEDEDEKEEQPSKKKKKVAFKTKKPAPSKKREKGAMNKKEEQELEKWAEQFNSQCAEISGYGLCVE